MSAYGVEVRMDGVDYSAECYNTQIGTILIGGVEIFSHRVTIYDDERDVLRAFGGLIDRLRRMEEG